MNPDKLKRTIGLASATSIGLGAMLGAGIFVFPGLAGGYAGFAAIISFLIGGIIALFVAACTAELATAMPQSGGGYFFISRAFGRFWGTMVGIAQWVGLIFACAFYLVSFGEYALTFLEELNIPWNASTKVFSFCFTFLLLFLNIIGTKKVGRFQNLMVISLTIILVLIFTYGLIDFLGIEDKAPAFSEIIPKGPLSIFTTTALIFTSYLGFVQIANIGAEIKNPSKNLPRSLIGSVLIAVALYAFVMLVSTITFPYEELKKFGETATIEVARKLLGNGGAILVVFAALLAALSSANASIISASRGVFALSKDELITSKATKINKRFGTPHIALILVTVPVTLMLVGSDLEVFAEVASFLHLVIYAGICLAVLKLRVTNPVWYIPTFRLPAAKAIAGIGALSCLILVFFMQKTSILMSLGVLILTMGYYFFFVRKKQLELSSPNPPHVDLQLLNPHVLIPVDLTQEKKSLPKAIMEVIPLSKVLLLGCQEIPEQSHSEQSEEEFGEEGKQKLADIKSGLEEANIQFDTKLIFDHKVVSQVKQVIEEENLRFVLNLKPLANLNQIIIPIYDLSQVNTELATIIYKLQSNRTTPVKVILFTEEEQGTSNESRLRQAMKHQLDLLDLYIHDFEALQKEEVSPDSFIKKETSKTDLVVWPEAASSSEKDLLLNIIFERESTHTPCPIIMIFREKREGQEKKE